MFERISRGWSLTKTSFKVLRMDPEILWLPLLAAVTMVVAVLGLGFGFFGLSAFDEQEWMPAGAAGILAILPP